MLEINKLTKLDLGVKDENKARDLYIDMNAWYKDYPNGTFSIWHKRNGDQTKYAASGASFDRETGILTWTPDAYDTYYIGRGLAEIRVTENDVIKKTKDILTDVEKSLVLPSGETLPSGWQNFLNQIESDKNAAYQYAQDAEDHADDAKDAKEAAEAAQEAAEDAKEAAEEAQDKAEDALSKYPYINETTGNWMLWDIINEEWVDTGYPSCGAVPNITVGTVTTGETGDPASVTRRSGSPDTQPVFDILLPKGDTGAVPNITVGTVTTGAAGTDVVVTRRSGSPDTAPVFDFTIPKGDNGDIFHITKTYASIAAMEADYSGTDVEVGEYVMIVSNVEDPDNAKVYIKGDQDWAFVVDMSGSAGIQGPAAYVHIKYAANEPTQDSDMKDTPDDWMGIYSGTSSTAPTTYSNYKWFEIKGATGPQGPTGPSGAGVPTGGDEDYALVKNSSTDLDVKWAKRGNVRRVHTYSGTVTNSGGAKMYKFDGDIATNSGPTPIVPPSWLKEGLFIMSAYFSSQMAVASDVTFTALVETHKYQHSVEFYVRPYMSTDYVIEIGEYV